MAFSNGKRFQGKRPGFRPKEADGWDKLRPMTETPKPLIPFRFGPSVFLAGAVILFVELAGAKLMAPLYGSSLYVWSALITVTLLAMASGAWAGGYLADRKPEPRVLSLLWLGSALTLGAVMPLRGLIFPLADNLDLRVGVLLSSLLLFFLPLAFLAAVSPLAVKLSRPSSDILGRTVGEVTAVGTAGSCFGALVTGFFLVPHFPLSRLFLSISLTLAFCGLTTLLGRRTKKP